MKAAGAREARTLLACLLALRYVPIVAAGEPIYIYLD